MHIHILRCLSTWHCFKLWRDAGNICELLRCRQPCSLRKQLQKEDQGAGWICCFVKSVTHLPCCLTGLQKGMLNPLSQGLIQKGACAWLRLFTLHSMLCHSRTVSSIANSSDKTEDLTRILNDLYWCIIHFCILKKKKKNCIKKTYTIWANVCAHLSMTNTLHVLF